MVDVLIVAHFIRGTIEGRFEYLANKLVEKGFRVELVTTDFSHGLKRTRKTEDVQLDDFKFKLTMLHESGYEKNITLKRFYSHYIMGKSLNEYLKNRKKPDIIYCAVPSLDVGKVAAKYAEQNNIPFIIDIQDIWPEAFDMVFHVPVISNLLFYFIKRQANYIYSVANEIVAVSQTYVDLALKVNKKCKNGLSVFLGTVLADYDKLVKENYSLIKPDNEVWLAYIGTLGHSYDLTCVLDALKIIKNRGIEDIQFVVMGDGPLKSKFESYANDLGLDVKFTGKLDYGKMVGILANCDIAVNPIIRRAAASIINKHGDYASAGLPVLNTQESIEYRKLVNEYKMGLNCDSSNAQDLANKLLILYNDKDLRGRMGQNSRKLAEDKFDRNKTYNNIIELITKTLN
jgi:glycosyltransferase involved in cell wall biosynthesis